MPKIIAQVPLLGGAYEIDFDDTINALAPSAAAADVQLGPTLFDIQVNGYAGRTCRMAGPDKRDALAWITRLMRQFGVGWWMPTITTASAQALETAFAACAQALDEDGDTAASIPGLHLEGPYISPVDGPRGAHNIEHVRPPDWGEFSHLQAVSGGRIKLVTIAPEVEGSVSFIERCRAEGVVVALGHTNLDRESLSRAVAAGATLSTHLGNGAHDQVQRHNNYLWYQLACEGIYASFIADGQHLPQECLYSMVRAKGLERSVLVSDAVLLGGMRPGEYEIGDNKVEMLPSGRIVLSGTPNLAGSAANLRECVEHLVAAAGIEPVAVWSMASLQPARLLGLDGLLGLEVGKEASFTVYQWDEEGPRLDVQQTWVGGRLVYDKAVTPDVVIPDRPVDAAAPI
ncbi:MAG: amidohydrolase family protein [Candidatus Latescibacteria bacterium]|nr:amidohydrolase family protein [Candidatus Latescibacterota bacterium]